MEADLLDIGASCLTECGDGVDGGDTLCQESVGRQLGELCTPQVGGQDALFRDPVLIDGL